MQLARARVLHNLLPTLSQIGGDWPAEEARGDKSICDPNYLSTLLNVVQEQCQPVAFLRVRLQNTSRKRWLVHIMIQIKGIAIAFSTQPDLIRNVFAFYF